MLSHKDYKEIENLGDSIKSIIDKLEREVSKVDSKSKGFVLNSIKEIKGKIKEGGDLNEEINKLKNYAGNR